MSDSLRIAVVNPPFPSPTRPGCWITVPPEGYGGIQWVVSHLIDGLLALGHEVFLLGAPDSNRSHPCLTIVPAVRPTEMRNWVRHASLDVIHDHTNGIVRPEDAGPDTVFLSTHHLTGRPQYPRNCVYLSTAQRANARATRAAPVVPIPVNVSRYKMVEQKSDFLLFLGRVSAHKGGVEAAAFARAAGLPLMIAGPSWEPDYRAQIEAMGSVSAKFLGEVGGAQRLDLLAGARAVLVLSQVRQSPWGGIWCEPGATVVSEAAASGTPVFATPNGCLPEIVPSVGHLVPYGTEFEPTIVREWLRTAPGSATLRSEAETRWGHVRIAAEYVQLYRARMDGQYWQ